VLLPPEPNRFRGLLSFGVRVEFESIERAVWPIGCGMAECEKSVTAAVKPFNSNSDPEGGL
jgi:hypothetical protein